ncbi:MAG: helix-turn-helix domain-containing protein [Bacteroidales bacterium]|nr:helix-turn-helix domain-containing protein [Bacteroidales bacterium]
MPAQIVTTDDLREFKLELLDDIKRMLKENSGQSPRKWLKSYEVRKMLSISPGTLQNLRLNGILPFTKMGGVLYYDQEDIQKILQANKKQLRF